MNSTNEENLDAIRDRVLTENTAQTVRNYLRNLESSRDIMLPRWIWELLQNARDASLRSGRRLIADIERTASEVVFQHNGRQFTNDEVTHLIYHGSTKAEDPETIGQYGSGFLTTHLLSPDIDVSGRRDDGQYFEFRISRKVGSVQELRDSMNQAWESYKQSLSTLSQVQSHDYTTQFKYPVSADATDAVDKGLEMLERCAPLIMVFNPEFYRIELKTNGGAVRFTRESETEVSAMGLSEVTVKKHGNGDYHSLSYLIAKNTTTSVAVPIVPTDNGKRALCPITDTPRLFLGFPLVGTEDFSFPGVINDFAFAPNDGRSGVYLGRSENPDNQKNQAAIEKACELTAGLLEHAANRSWQNTYEMARIPPIHEREWLNPAWLRDTIKSQFIEVIRQTPAVLTEEGAAKSPHDAQLPLAQTDAGVETLWDLLNEWQGGSGVLPRRAEAIGWWHTVKSWANVQSVDEDSLNEVVDGRKLAQRIEGNTRDNGQFGSLEDLQAFLVDSVSAIGWLNRMYAFLKDDGLSDVVGDSYIIPNQDGLLDKLPRLFRDEQINEELKDTAELLDRNVRQELRDVRLTSLDYEIGKGNLESEQLVQELVATLQQRAEKDPDDSFKKASVRLFAWIVGRKDWSKLRSFPVFAEESSVDNPRIIRLMPSSNEDELLLAPISAWQESLRPYAELFPTRYTLAHDFFEVEPDTNTWQTLDKQGFLKNDVLITKILTCDEFLPDENLTDDVDHASREHIAVTSVAFLTRDDIGIMARVRQSQPLARLFWRFLTEWLVHNDPNGLIPHEAACDCEKNHFYFPAEWLGPIKKRQWVPLGARRSNRATAESLAVLLRSSGNEAGRVIEDRAVIKLLDAVGVARVDLMRGLVAATDEDRSAMDSELIHLMAATGGNVVPIREFAEDLENDSDLLSHLAERREQRLRVHENQALGANVENLVKANLEGAGFSVHRTGVGSDFKIAAELGDVANLQLTSGERSWLVEVKSTRDQRVRMTDTQAKTAVEEGDRFLLCVVPVEPGSNSPEVADVQANMRFVADIGTRVDSLCNNLGEFEELRYDITADELSGVQLEIASGPARVRVASSVWENDGFPLEDLAGRLAQ